MFQKLRDAGIPYSIGPGVSLRFCEEVLQFSPERNGKISPLWVFTLPVPFMRNGLTATSRMRWQQNRVLLPLVSAVWTIIISVRNSIYKDNEDTRFGSSFFQSCVLFLL